MHAYFKHCNSHLFVQPLVYCNNSYFTVWVFDRCQITCNENRTYIKGRQIIIYPMLHLWIDIMKHRERTCNITKNITGLELFSTLSIFYYRITLIFFIHGSRDMTKTFNLILVDTSQSKHLPAAHSERWHLDFYHIFLGLVFRQSGKKDVQPMEVLCENIKTNFRIVVNHCFMSVHASKMCIGLLYWELYTVFSAKSFFSSALCWQRPNPQGQL